MSVTRQVEAILFASSTRMTVEDIASLIDGSNKKVIEQSLRELQTDYNERDTSITLKHEEGSWKFSVKEEFLPIVEKLMPSTDLPTPVVETLAILAWKAPVLQSDIIKVRSASAYEHIAELEKLNLIKRVKQGRSFVIKLTEKFYDYFDIPEDAIKSMVQEPKEEEQQEIIQETDEERKERLMKEVRDNQINPEEIINQDKEYLDEFDKRLEEVDKNSEMVKPEFEIPEVEGEETENIKKEEAPEEE